MDNVLVLPKDYINDKFFEWFTSSERLGDKPCYTTDGDYIPPIEKLFEDGDYFHNDCFPLIREMYKDKKITDSLTIIVPINDIMYEMKLKVMVTTFEDDEFMKGDFYINFYVTEYKKI